MRSVANQEKRRAIFEKYRTCCEMLILQETHSTISTEKIWESEWGGKIIFCHGTAAARGIALLCSKETYAKLSNIEKDLEGRKIIVDLEEHGVKLTIAAIYAPNKDCPEFFIELGRRLKGRHEHKVVIGDYNLVLDVEMDRENTYCNNNKAKEEVINLSDEYQLRDVWRIQNPDKREFSWRKGKTYPVTASRIDYALVSGGIDQKVELSMYTSSIKTDHRAFYMTIQLDPFERGNGYWKLNNTLLQDKEFVKLMNQELDQSIMASMYKQPDERWEIVKKRVKTTATKYARGKASEDKLIISQLSEKVTEYESRLPLTREEDKLLEESRAEWEERSMERAKGIIFRSKARWYEQGEKSTKYFFSLEKSKYNAKTCFRLITENGDEIDDPKLILEEQKRFYENLYSAEEDVEFSLENKYGIYVSESIKSNQEKQISMADLECAIKQMKNNKTPGQDGLPIDFYKVFWTKIKQCFYEMMLYNYKLGKLHETARKGILNLIPKQNKDTRFVKNLRPITLLNTDYKIIEKAVANKMVPALEQIIHKDQRGFMKERRISVNIRKMLDIMHQVQKEDMEAVILSLDFVKCFDKCSFTILHGSLKFFEFGLIVREWTKILYHDFSVTVQNNGHFSSNIPIKKGVHQGGCCSSIYFLVIAEILALALRDNQDIEGITIGQIKNLLNQFADDMDIFSQNSEKSLRAILQELERFKKHSGFTVSYEKTTLYRVGSLRHSSAQLYNLDELTWSNEDIKVLGVTIAHEDIMEKNYEQVLRKVEATLNAWHNRGLSLIGKVQVVNTLIASLFVYKMMVLPSISELIVKKVENSIRQFLWNGKKSKIALSILQNPKDSGGLELVNLRNKDKALKATWPKILNKEDEYAQIVYSQMKCDLLGEDIWRCTILPQDIDNIRITNQFWKDVWKSWSEYNYYKDFRIENQLIWYNSHIRVQDKPIWWRDICAAGLKYIYQMFEKGDFKTDYEMKQQFGLSTLRYNALKGALPAEWKKFFVKSPPAQYMPLAPNTHDRCLSGDLKKLTNKVYWYLAEDVMIIHNKYMKWRQELGEDFCQGLCDYGKKHLDVFKVTNVPKYRSFQYRLLQRGLVTNILLEKWKIIPSENCTFCHEVPETVCHMLYDCNVVYALWQDFVTYVLETYKLRVNLSVVNVMLNEVAPKGSVINFLCLIIKQYVYSQRCLKKELSFYEIKSRLKNIECIEKYIAVKHEKLVKHVKKWSKPSVNIMCQTNLSEFVEEYIVNL